MVGGDRRRHDDRGQLVVIAALVVALAVFGSVVLLNSVHSSPDIAAKADADGLSETDRISAELRQEFRQLFLRTNASGPVARTNYVNGTYFNASVVSEFSAEYNRLLGTDRPAVVTIDYREGKRVSGALVYGNDSTLNGTEQLLNNASTGSEVPMLSITANVSSEIAFEFNDTSAPASTFLNVTDTNVTKNETGAGETTVCTLGSSANETEITLRYGTGDIAADTAFCRNVDIDIGTFDEVVLHGDGSDVESLDFQLSVTNADCRVSSCADSSTVATIDLNPTFVTRIETPSSSYNSTIPLYGGGSSP